MIARGFCILATLLLAGCSDRPVGPQPEGNLPIQDQGTLTTNGTLPHETGWMNVTFTVVRATGTYGLQGSNCVIFDETDIKAISAGFAQVSWESPNPAADVMTFEVRRPPEGGERIVTGSSPLRLDLTDFQAGNWGISVLLRTDVIDAQVSMQLNWDFEYEGASPLPHYTAACG